jgi:metal-responsive CopG/Arc/MetJ family transcriptional regulator
MAQRVKLTLSLNEDVVAALDNASRQSKRSRSRLVEEAIRLWRRKELQESLAQGYRAMADEDRKTAERHLRTFQATEWGNIV